MNASDARNQQSALPNAFADNTTTPDVAFLPADWQAVLLQAPAGIVLLSVPQYHITFANDHFLSITGKYRAALLHKPAIEAIPAAGEDLVALFDKICKTGEPVTGYEQKANIEIDGRLQTEYLNFVYKPVKKEDGSVSQIMILVTDVTGQVLARKKVEESENQFRTMADFIPQLAWMTDPEGGIFWYNRRWYDYTGTTFNEMQGWGWRTVHHPDLIEGVIERFQKAIKAGAAWEDTFLLRGKDGVYRWFLSRAQPIRNAAGNVVHWFGTNTDISEQQQTEQALKNAKEQLELTFRNVPSAIYHFDKKGHILYLNEKGAQQMGYKTVDEVLAEKDVFLFRKKLDAVFYVTDEWNRPLPTDQSSAAITFRTGKPSEVISQFINKQSGESFWLLAKSAPLFDEHGELSIVLTTSTDITLQKTAEQSIRQSEEKFRTLTEALPQLIWMTDEKGTYEYASTSWRSYTDLNPKDYSTWEHIVHAGDMPHITEAWSLSLETGQPYRAEVRLRSRYGEYRWHLVNGEPIRNAHGDIVKWIGAFTDIHFQKTEAERLETLVQERTRELQRSNEDLQQFAHVASHDLKEPVRKIRTFGNRLQEEFGSSLPERATAYIGKIENAALRMYKMIDGVLEYSTISSAEQALEPLDLNEIIHHIKDDLEVVIQQKGAVIHYQNLPVIEGSPILLHQLFYNLINNALKFSRQDVQPHITISSAPLKPAEWQPEWRLNRNLDYVQLAVQDNGIGFSQDQAERIFKSFTRLNARDKYEGTGLGLALCKKIVERHNGAISAAGMEGMGAIFKVVLPQSSK